METTEEDAEGGGGRRGDRRVAKDVATAQGFRTLRSVSTITAIMRHRWRLLLLDEAHCAPADALSRAINQLKAGSGAQGTDIAGVDAVVGLTATPLREDDKMQEFEKVVPIVYAAPWKELTDQGVLARVRCVEVRCDMPLSWRSTWEHNDPDEGYEGSGKSRAQEANMRRQRRKLLCALNPNKINVCAALLQHHTARGDRVLIFAQQVR